MSVSIANWTRPEGWTNHNVFCFHATRSTVREFRSDSGNSVLPMIRPVSKNR